jgi:hypothetical protein
MVLTPSGLLITTSKDSRVRVWVVAELLCSATGVQSYSGRELSFGGGGGERGPQHAPFLDDLYAC